MTHIQYVKGINASLSSHFNSREFDCHCNYPDCTTTPVCGELVNLLEKFRTAVGCPVRINSGYRCEKYNKDIGGEEHSQHVLGRAADVARVDGVQWTDTDRLMAEHIFANNGLGTYILPNGRYLFFHLDTRPHTARWQVQV